MLLNQFMCTESPVLVYGGVYGIADTRKDGITLPTLPSCDVVWWPGATPTILSVLSFFRHSPGDICCPDTFRLMTSGHV